MGQRFCRYCNTPLQPGVEVCGNCGTYQYGSQAEAQPTYPEYSGPFQPPTGMRADVSLQMAPGQYVLMMPPAIAVMPLAGLRISGFAVASMVLGIPATILALLDLIFDSRAALEQLIQPTPLGIVLILALFCWAPALIALIFGLLAKSKIWRDKGQTQGLGLAYTGITLGSISLALPLLGILLFALTLLP